MEILDFAVCKETIVPMRSMANDRAEMVSQLLFGETCKITDANNNWLYIVCDHDEYEGWVDRKQILLISEQQYHETREKEQFVSTDLVSEIVDNAGNKKHIVAGSSLPGLKNDTFEIGNKQYTLKGNYSTLKTQNSKLLAEISKRYIGSPYLWGGRNPFGLDCSGFTQIIFKMAGNLLPRDASEQADRGTVVNFISEAEAGDLVFFDNAEGEIIHVGILLSPSKIIHSSGCVRIDHIDHHGIYNQNEERYTHKLRVIKRVT